MAKKTTAVAKKTTKVIKKGGNTRTDVIGPLIPQSLYKLENIDKEDNKLDKLENIYTNKEEETLQKLKNLQDRLKTISKSNQAEQAQTLNDRKFQADVANKNSKLALERTKQLTSIANATLINASMFTKFMVDNVKFGITTVFNSGEGVILKCIVVFTIIALFVILIVGLTTGVFNGGVKNVGGNDISKNILNSDNENYITQPNSFSLLKSMSNGLNNLLPPEFKYSFASLTNSISYITTGKNQYEDFLIPRETLDVGRSDNIFHINLQNHGSYDNRKTFCALSPKEIDFTFSSNLYTSADYNKLDENLRNDINYPTSYTIPFKTDNGRYALDIGGSYYNKDINKLPKLFKTSGKSTEIIFNSFNSISGNKMFGIIGLYGAILLNRDYKGPILKLTTHNYAKLRISKEAAKNEVELYYSNDTYYYYDNKHNYVPYNFDRANYTYYVNILYDQSGNNRDFVYLESDNKYQPVLTDDKTIKFTTKNIMYLNMRFNFSEMQVKTKIKVNKFVKGTIQIEDHYKIVQGNENAYMNLLSNYNTPIIKLKIQKNADNMPDTYNIDIQDDYTKVQINNDNTKYNTDEIANLTIDIDVKKNKQGIQTLGTIHDDRTEEDLRKLPQGDPDGNILTQHIEAHNFVGELYELYIYDRTKL